MSTTRLRTRTRPGGSSGLRWLVVAVLALAVALPPTLLRLVPASGSDLTAAQLLAKVRAAADRGWSGEVRAVGSLQVPLTGSTFGGVARLLGEQSDLRVFWRDPEHWRVDRLAAGGERDLVRDGRTTTTWSYESGRARVSAYSPVRLPDDADLVPAALAKRVLAGARASELSRLESRRIAGRSAAGLRLVPADQRATVDRVDVWVDDATGIPLRVDAYAAASTPGSAGSRRPVLTTEVTTLDTDRPAARLTRFSPAAGVDVRRTLALDEAAGANAFAPFRLPDRAAGLARRGDPATFGAVGVYGRGPLAVLAVPLRGSVTRGLVDQLRGSPAAVDTGGKITLQIGPLSVLLLHERRGGLLVTGTATPAALDDVAQDLVEKVVVTR